MQYRTSDSKELGKIDCKLGSPTRRHLKCARKNIVYDLKTILTSFGQNTAEFYDIKAYSLTVLCISLPEFELKPRNVALHLTENDFFLNIALAPPYIHVVLKVSIARKATVGW